MGAIAANLIVSTSPEELVHGILGQSTTIDNLNIVNNSGNPYTVALYYTRNVIRTCLFKYNLDGGDIVQDKGPYVILANDNLEIETDAGVEVTFSMLRQPL